MTSRDCEWSCVHSSTNRRARERWSDSCRFSHRSPVCSFYFFYQQETIKVCIIHRGSNPRFLLASCSRSEQSRCIYTSKGICLSTDHCRMHLRARLCHLSGFDTLTLPLQTASVNRSICRDIQTDRAVVTFARESDSKRGDFSSFGPPLSYFIRYKIWNILWKCVRHFDRRSLSFHHFEYLTAFSSYTSFV